MNLDQDVLKNILHTLKSEESEKAGKAYFYKTGSGLYKTKMNYSHINVGLAIMVSKKRTEFLNKFLGEHFDGIMNRQLRHQSIFLTFKYMIDTGVITDREADFLYQVFVNQRGKMFIGKRKVNVEHLFNKIHRFLNGKFLYCFYGNLEVEIEPSGFIKHIGTIRKRTAIKCPYCQMSGAHVYFKNFKHVINCPNCDKYYIEII